MNRPRRKTYLVTLIIDDDVVIEIGHTDNCRTAVRGAFSALLGIPSAECTVRADGELLAFLTSDWKGEIKKMEFHPPNWNQRCVDLNPHWNLWPKLSESIRRDRFETYLRRSS